jgi:nucleotide-binding universal stress UspA family protein
MDTTQVPEFKLAKVGKKRERKKAGVFWTGGGSGGAFTGATGGMGVLAIKGAIILGMAVLGAGAYNVGMSMAPKSGALSKPKAFASKEVKDASAGAAVVGPAPASGLAMVSGSLDGKTPEQRAAEAAAAEAAAKAEADRKAKEEEDARKAAEEEAKKAAASPDADAVAAAAGNGAAGGAGKNSAFGSRFGQLSSSLGGGHSGLAGGAGLSGGIGRSFGSAPNLGATGKSHGQAKQVTAGRAGARAIANKGHSSRAFRQLVAANKQSQIARNSTSEGAASAADSAFENNPGADKAITGGGAGQGGAGAGDSAPGGATSGNSGPTGCTGDCAGGTGGNPGHTDASPWKDQIKTAAGLAVAASALLIIAGIWSLMQWPYCKIVAGILGGLAAALGVAVLGLGGSIQSMGGPGTMYMVTGGIIAAAGGMVLANAASGMQGALGVSSTMISWAGIFGGLLGGATSAGDLMAPSGDAAGAGGGSSSSDGTFHKHASST